MRQVNIAIFRYFTKAHLILPQPGVEVYPLWSAHVAGQMWYNSDELSIEKNGHTEVENRVVAFT